MIFRLRSRESFAAPFLCRDRKKGIIVVLDNPSPSRVGRREWGFEALSEHLLWIFGFLELRELGRGPKHVSTVLMFMVFMSSNNTFIMINGL